MGDRVFKMFTVFSMLFFLTWTANVNAALVRLDCQSIECSLAFPGFCDPGYECMRAPGYSYYVCCKLTTYPPGKHKGCVNTVHFNPTGDLIVSDSDENISGQN